MVRMRRKKRQVTERMSAATEEVMTVVFAVDVDDIVVVVSRSLDVRLVARRRREVCRTQRHRQVPQCSVAGEERLKVTYRPNNLSR